MQRYKKPVQKQGIGSYFLADLYKMSARVYEMLEKEKGLAAFKERAASPLLIIRHPKASSSSAFLEKIVCYYLFCNFSRIHIII